MIQPRHDDIWPQSAKEAYQTIELDDRQAVGAHAESMHLDPVGFQLSAIEPFVESDTMMWRTSDCGALFIKLEENTLCATTAKTRDNVRDSDHAAKLEP